VHVGYVAPEWFTIGLQGPGLSGHSREAPDAVIELDEMKEAMETAALDENSSVVSLTRDEGRWCLRKT